MKFIKEKTPEIIEVVIDENIFNEANRLNELMEEQHKNGAERQVFTSNHDIIGAIGQLCVVKQINEWGFEVVSEYYDPRVIKDKCDFEWRVELVDVKSSPKGEYGIWPNSRLLVKEASKDKIIDRYVFCKVDIDKRKCYIVGCSTYFDFWERYGEPFMSTNIKSPCYGIYAKNLTPFHEFIFGV